MKEDNLWIAACGIDCSRCSIHNLTKEELDYWKSQNIDLDITQ